MKIEGVCFLCEKKFLFEKSRKIKSKRIFCTKSCFLNFTKTKQSRAENKLRNEKEKNPFFGKVHSEETKKILSEKNFGKVAGENNPFFGKKHSKETRKRMSETRIQKILNKEINVINRSRHGEFDGVKFDSFYELKRILDLKRQNVTFKKNYLKIPYKFKNKEHIYIPDLYIVNADGTIVVEEVKGYLSDKDKIKHKYAEKFLKKLNIKFKIINFKDLFASNAEYRLFLKEYKHENS